MASKSTNSTLWTLAGIAVLGVAAWVLYKRFGKGSSSPTQPNASGSPGYYPTQPSSYGLDNNSLLNQLLGLLSSLGGGGGAHGNDNRNPGIAQTQSNAGSIGNSVVGSAQDALNAIQEGFDASSFGSGYPPQLLPDVQYSDNYEDVGSYQIPLESVDYGDPNSFINVQDYNPGGNGDTGGGDFSGDGGGFDDSGGFDNFTGGYSGGYDTGDGGDYGGDGGGY